MSLESFEFAVGMIFDCGNQFPKVVGQRAHTSHPGIGDGVETGPGAESRSGFAEGGYFFNRRNRSGEFRFDNRIDPAGVGGLRTNIEGDWFPAALSARFASW